VVIIERAKDPRLQELIGKCYTMKNGQVAKIIGGTLSKLQIEFIGQYPSTRICTYSNLAKGLVKNYRYPNVYGIGYWGDGTYRKSNYAREYQVWADMLYRCSTYYKVKYHNTYLNAHVSAEFADFSYFCKWIISQNNYLQWKNGERWCLDKDIIGGKGNKEYSPENCCLVPNNVNTLFVKKDKNRGNLPIGVMKNHNNYMAMCSNPIVSKRQYYLGTFSTPEMAFAAYKKCKEDIIKQVADSEYANGNITKRCHDAMYQYEVEITD
jgi:hypothetical protein